jgi:hypothetical protein|tara:strand:- start:1054 stop:1284 length:231 start_codon:yes stop_codon:yes gene_type:complete
MPKSKTSQAMSHMSECFSYTSDQVKSNFIEFVRENKINLNDEEMLKISSILEQSVMQSFTRVSSRIEKSFNNLLAE